MGEGAHYRLRQVADFAYLHLQTTAPTEELYRYRERGDMLQTRTGNEIFACQLDRQIRFFEDLLKESRLTTLPSV